MAGEASGGLSKDLARRLSFRLLPLLFALFLLKEIDRSNVGFAALSMNQALGIAPTIFGTGAAIFLLSYIVMTVLGGAMLARFGARRMIFWMMLAWGLIAMATAFTVGIYSFYTWRVLLGLAEGAFTPAATLYIGLWFPRSERATAMAWLYTTTSLQAVIGGPLSGAILELPSFFGLASWQWLFIIEGLPTVVVAFLARRYLTDRPEEANWLDSSQRAELVTALRRGASASVASNNFTALRDWRVWGVAFVYCCMGAYFFSMIFWLPQIVRQVHDVRPFYIGLITAGPNLVSAIAMVLLGRYSDRVGTRYPLVVVGLVASAVCLAVSAYVAQSPFVSLLALMLAIVFISPVVSPFWTFVTELLDGPARAMGVSIAVAGGSVGGFAANLFLGWFREHFGDFRGALYAIGCVVLLAAFVLWAMGAHEKRGRSIRLSSTGRA